MDSILDTSVAIALRDRDEHAMERVSGLPGTVFLSAMTRVELEGGVHREPDRAPIRRTRLDAMIASLPMLPFEEADVIAYGHIVEVAGYSRRKMLDRLIAAQAIVRGMTLVTANATDFRDIAALKLIEL